jgi:putative ABC transport system substrate-binding protein
MPYPMTFNLRQGLINAANQRGMPTIYGSREFVAEGGFMSYGGFRDGYRQVGAYVDKLARGLFKAANLSIEQPTQFQLVVNLKTAAMLGIALPRAMLLRADELIQ